jgi:predicted Zn-dependent protease
LNKKGDKEAAISLLKRAIRENPKYLDGYEMLAEMYESGGQPKEAASALRDGLKQPGLPRQVRSEWEARAEKLEGK